MPQAGEIIDAGDVNAVTTFYIVKPADESVTSSIALQNDDDFSVTLTPGIWLVELALSVTGNTQASGVGDIITDWTTTGTMTNLSLQISGPSQDATTAILNSLPRMQGGVLLTNAPRFGTDGTNQSFIYQRLLLDVDVTGVLQMRWAQGASSAVATIVKAGSHMTWRQLVAG